jgi:hypothetical protein
MYFPDFGYSIVSQTRNMVSNSAYHSLHKSSLGDGRGHAGRRRISSREFAAEATPPVRIDPNSPRCAAIRCATANDLLIDLELRLGGGSRRLIGYGLFAPGLALGMSQVGRPATRPPASGSTSVRACGGLVWRGLFLGGEALVSPTIYADLAGSFHSSTTSVGLSLRLLVGWHFGWRGRSTP